MERTTSLGLERRVRSLRVTVTKNSCSTCTDRQPVRSLQSTEDRSPVPLRAGAAVVSANQHMIVNKR